MASRLSPVLVILVGLSLFIGPFLLFPHAGQQNCVNFVEPTSADEIPSNADVLRYEELSPAAKQAFDQARAASDGTATVYGERCPDEFRYTDFVGEYYIQSDDEYYVLETASGGGLFPIGIIYGMGFGLVGGALILLGGYSSIREQPTQVQEFVYGGLAGFGVLLLVLAAVDANFVLVLGLTLLAIVLTYGVIGYDLPVKPAVGFALVASLGVLVALVGFGFRGSITIVVLLPPIVIALGIVSRILRVHLIE